jgi:hypothetical protein
MAKKKTQDEITVYEVDSSEIKLEQIKVLESEIYYSLPIIEIVKYDLTNFDEVGKYWSGEQEILLLKRKI